MKGFLTTKEAGDRLGVSARRVVAMIKAGSLPAESIGRIHLIKESDLSRVKDRKPGRPFKKGNCS